MSGLLMYAGLCFLIAFFALAFTDADEGDAFLFALFWPICVGFCVIAAPFAVVVEAGYAVKKLRKDRRERMATVDRWLAGDDDAD